LRAQAGSIRRFGFASAIIRHASYSELTTPHRLRLHRAVAERLEASDRDRAAEIAEHWFAATALAGVGAQHLPKAIAYAEDAGRRAAEEGAFREAGRQYRHAAQLVDASEAGSRRQCELLLKAGTSYAQGDQIPEAKDAFRGAAEMARQVGDSQLLVAAALGHGMGSGDAFYVAGVDEPLVGLLEQALAGLGDDRGPLRVRVLSRLAVELHLTGFVERRETLSRQAVELAESIADPASELIALYGWLTANWSPDELPGRLAGSDEVIRRAGELDDLEMVYNGHDMKLRALLELGDMAGVDREIAQLEHTASAIGKPLFGWHVRSCRAMRALHAGDAREADRWMRDALEVGSHADRTLAQRSAQAQAALRHWLVGRPRELIPILRSGVESCPWLAVRRARLAFGLADLGRKTEAVAEFERLAQDDFGALPHDGNWLLTIGFLAFACAALGDAARARSLTAALEPYGDRFLVSGDATTTWGPVSTAQAVLAVTLGDYDDAADRFERALEQCEATGGDAHGVFARREYARMLGVRGRPGDHARAQTLLHDAASTSARRGFDGLAEQVATLQAATKVAS
jgi:tetratricopeptide (TPR) repeat protein